MPLMRVVFFIALSMIFLAGCSSDPDTPLGSEFVSDGILGSYPGEVFEDTLFVAGGDKSFWVSSTIDRSSTLALGRKGGYVSSIILRIDFSEAIADSSKEVDAAFLYLRRSDPLQTDTLYAKFYEMPSPYSEGDSITLLPRTTPIPDSSGAVERVMMLVPSKYSFPPGLVQAWIRGEVEHKGIFIAVTDTSLEKEVIYGSRESGDEGLHPFMSVDFKGGSTSYYSISGDATFVESVRATSNLVLSDGYARRIFIPLELSSIDENSFIHSAELILSIVASSDLGSNFDVVLYAPRSDNTDDPGILSGIRVTRAALNPASSRFDLTMRNVLMLFLSGELENNGLVLRFENEGSQVRQVEFYESSAGLELRPRIVVTYSAPPIFRR